MSPATRLLSALVLLFPVLLHGQTPVGTDAPIRTISLTLAAGTLDSVEVLTNGSPSFDYKQAPGGTCTPGQTYLAGQTCTVNVAFHPLFPGERRGAVVLLARSAAPLAQQFFSARATGSVNVFIPGTITTVAGNQNWIYAGDGQLATNTNIFLPFGLAVDAAGNLFLADSSNNRIRKVDFQTQLVSTLAGNGNIGSTGDGGPADQASLSNPSSIALDPAGNLYFADSGNNAIRRIDAVTGVVSTVAGTLGRHGYTGDAGPATGATLNTPNGLALDASGNLFFADTGNHVIRRVDAVTGLISTIAGTGVPGFNGDGASATRCQLYSPWSVAVAPAGELYIADQNNHRIRRVALDGTLSTIAGTGTAGFSGDKQPAAQAQLNSPASVVLDAAGNLYIADSGNNRVRKISARDGTIKTIAGIDGESFSGDSGPADQAGLYGPYALALDGADNLFLADVFHNRIRRIAANQVALHFPAIRVGRVSDPIRQTVENDGDAPLVFSDFSAQQHSAVDPTTTTCSVTTPLATLDTCVIGAQFAPTATGDPVQGKLALSSDAGNAPGIIVPWGTVLAIDPTTLALASSANPAVTGSTITFTAKASSAGSTPSGDVTFTDVFTDSNGQQSTLPLGTVTLANGAAAVATSALTVGQHSITATYAGDPSNASATSRPLVELVKDAQAPTVTSVASSANPLDAGAPLTLTATVATRTQGSGSANIAGSVTFFSDGSPIGTATLDAATATFDRATGTLTVSSLAVGNHALVAAYAGNSSDTPSTSAPLQQVIRLATTRLALTASANPAIAGGPLTLVATATSSGGAPTGSISFAVNGNPLGSAGLSGQGVATLPLASIAWAPGTYNLTAAYAGDAANSPATSQPVIETVTLASSALTLASSLNPAGMGAQIIFTATASSNGGTPAGIIHFLDGNTPLGNATLSSAGIASLATSSLAIGAHSITATYAGDTYDTPAQATPLAEQINAASTSVALSTSSSPALFGNPVTLSAAVTGTGSAPAGSIAFYDAATLLATVPLDLGGHAAFRTSSLSIADHSITAVYSGDSNHAQTSSAPITEVIQQSTSLALQPSATQSVAGLAISLRAVVTGAQAQALTGTITLADGAATLAVLQPDVTGLVTLAWKPAPGLHAISASYSGDHLDAASAAPAQPLTVDRASTSTALTPSANPAAFGSPLTLVARVTGNGAIPGGTVTFSDGATILSSAALDATGTASLTLTTLAPGLHALTAAYAGDPNDSPSQSPAHSIQVALHPTLTLTASANPALLGDPVILTLAAANGSVTPPTGSVSLTDNGIPLGPQPLVNGTAQLTLAKPTLGSHTFLATYAGDAANGPATAQPLVLSVTLRPSVTALTASSTALAAGQQLILISVVQAQGAQAASGTVTFQAGTQVLGTVPMSPAGVATLTLTPPTGVLTLTAHYSGDALFAASISAAVAVSVGPPNAFILTPMPATLSFQTGAHASVNLSIASNPAFHDDLALGCAGLPAYATCHFSADRLTITPGLPQSVTVTIDTGNPLGLGPSAAAFPLQRPLACCASALLACILRRRKRLALGLTALLMACISGALTGCATQFSQSTTAPGEYAVQVVATGTATHTTQTATIHLTVTK